MNDILPLAIVIAIEPLPIIGFILVLSTDRGVKNGAAFIAAWFACLAVIVIGTLAITGGQPLKPATAPATATFVVTLLVGLVLLGIAVERRMHPRPEPPEPPGWAKKVDEMHAGGAAVLGFLLQPWALIAAAAADVAKADLSNAVAVVQLVLFALIATSVLLAMQIYTMRSPEVARAKLDALRSWIDRHRNRAITILAFIVGVWLTTKGIYGLVTQ